jgi:hypothetical protein
LAFHALVKDESLEDIKFDLFWSELPLGDEGAAAIAGLCRRIAKRPASVPYGIVYEGGKLSDDGSVILNGLAIGLTCATYVLALLRSSNHDIVHFETWPPRADDSDWHGHIIKMLIGFHCRHPDLLTMDHILAVSREHGCARFRPEEVASAAQAQWPVLFNVAEPRGREARAFLVARAVSSEG